MSAAQLVPLRSSPFTSLSSNTEHWRNSYQYPLPITLLSTCWPNKLKLKHWSRPTNMLSPCYDWPTSMMELYHIGALICICDHLIGVLPGFKVAAPGQMQEDIIQDHTRTCWYTLIQIHMVWTRITRKRWMKSTKIVPSKSVKAINALKLSSPPLNLEWKGLNDNQTLRVAVTIRGLWRSNIPELNGAQCSEQIAQNDRTQIQNIWVMMVKRGNPLWGILRKT